MSSFLQRVEAATNLKVKIQAQSYISDLTFKQRVEAKYAILDTMKDWAKKFVSGLVATMILTSSLYGATIKNPKDVAAEMEKGMQKGGYTIQYNLEGGDDSPQQADFKVMKDGKVKGTIHFIGLPDKDSENMDNKAAIDLSFEKGLDKDAHIALLSAKLAFEKKVGTGDASSTADTLNKVMQHDATQYGENGYKPISDKLLKKSHNLDKTKSFDKTKTVEKTKSFDKTKTADKTKGGDLGKSLTKTGSELGKDLTKTAKNLGDNASKVGKDLSKDAKKAWEGGKSFLKKLANN